MLIFKDDSEYKNKELIQHREFLDKKSKYIEVVSFKDVEKVKQIKYNFRVLYLKDCALGYCLDDKALSVLTNVEY